MKRVEDSLLCSFPVPELLLESRVSIVDVDSELSRVRADNPKWQLLISYGQELVRVYLFRKELRRGSCFGARDAD